MGADDSDSTPLLRPDVRLLRPAGLKSGPISLSTGVPVEGKGTPWQASDRASKAAYLFGCQALLSEPAAFRRGYRLFWVVGEEVGWIDLEASATSYAVIGSHDQCDLQIPKGPHITARQLLASCFLRRDGEPMLRLLDLHSGHPFAIEGKPCRSVCVRGPVLLTVGACVLGCVPLPDFHALTRSGGYALRETLCVESALPPEEILTPASGQHQTHVTLLPASRRLEDAIAAPRRSEHPGQIVPAAPSRITLTRQEQSVSLDLTDADLYTGVLIGRSETCAERRLRHVLSGQISRLHVLLLAEYHKVYAMDLCSTNGTWQDQQRIRRVELSGAGERLVLSGSDSKVELIWHPAGSRP